MRAALYFLRRHLRSVQFIVTSTLLSQRAPPTLLRNSGAQQLHVVLDPRANHEQAICRWPARGWESGTR